MSASPVLSVPCLPSCVSLSGGVRLSGLGLCLVSLHLFPFIHVFSLSGGVRLSGLVCALSPFICLPSCVSLEWWCPPLQSCLCLVSLHLSPFMCLHEWGVRLASLVCALTPLICVPLCISLSARWCPPRRSCLWLVSLHVSP